MLKDQNMLCCSWYQDIWEGKTTIVATILVVRVTQNMKVEVSGTKLSTFINIYATGISFELSQNFEGEYSFCMVSFSDTRRSGHCAALQYCSERIRTSVALLRSLLNFYSWEKYETSYPLPSFGLDSTTIVLLQRWLWY